MMKLRSIKCVSVLAAALAVAPGGLRAQKPSGLRVSLGKYLYDYQADPRKPLPAGQPVAQPDGSSALAVHPTVGVGPWFGYGHAMWHRDNLSALRRAGLDIVLPVFRADSASLAGYAEAGLDTMAQALIELRGEKLDYPLVAMYLDTGSFGDGGRALDVGAEAGKARFYDAVRRFFRRIPPEFRAQAQTRDGIANILVVGPARSLRNLDASLRTYVDGRYFAEFGRRLIWLGSPDWKPAAGNLDGYFADVGGALSVNREGPLTVASLGPGLADTSAEGRIVPRQGGLALLNAWRDLFAMFEKPDWVVFDSWNDYTRGTAVAGTREYGVRETDGMMAGLLQFRNDVGPVAQALYVNAPDVLGPRSLSVIEIVAQNGTLDTWKPGDILVSASWYRDGRKVDDGPRVPILQQVPMMGVLNLPVVLAAVGKDGTALAEGLYEVRVELFRASRDDKGALVETPFKEPLAVFPVTVGKPPADVARLVSSDTSPWLMAGEPAVNRVILRNDGSKPWPKGKARVTCTLFRVSDAASEAVASGSSEPLSRDIASGDVTDPVAVTLKPPADARPLPPGGDAWYELRWSVDVAPAAPAPVLETTAVPARRVVNVLPLVSIAHFPLGNNAQPNWEAGKDQEVRTVLHNRGLVTWKAGEVQVGYHWYYWDGTEAAWESPKVPLSRDLKPGDEAMVRLNVSPPPRLGAYVLVLDVWDGKQWLSTLPASAGLDLTMACVTVLGGGWRCVDLTGLFDLDGVAGELSPADGDFSGGLCFPSECVPPDVQPPLPLSGSPMTPFPPGISPLYYPAGYFGPLDTAGSQSIRRIPFRYPDKKDGTRNFIIGRGQSLPLGRGLYTRLYLLAAGTKDLDVTLTLNYADGASGAVPLKVSAWNAPPAHGEAVGLKTRFLRPADGRDVAGSGYLFVYEIPVDAAKVLESITFPVASDFRVMAVTAQERSGGPVFATPAAP
jgi:hypothetical protein